jgi:anti-sigma factor RsiW
MFPDGPRVHDKSLPMSMATQLPPLCASYLRCLWEYLDDELPETEASEMRDHVTGCPRCGPHAAFERRLLDRIGAVRPEAGESSALRARIAAVLASEHPRPDQTDG